MAEGKSSPKAWEAYNQIWQTYYRFRPQNEYESVWYAQSLTTQPVLRSASTATFEQSI